MQPDPRLIPPPTYRRSALAGTWWWTLVPVITCGMGTFIMVLLGGIKLRSRAHQIAGVCYLAATLVFILGVQFTTPENTGPIANQVIVPFAVVPWVGGIAHVLYLQFKVHAATTASNGPAPWVNVGMDPAIARAQWRAERRRQARQLMAAQPALAADLRIGRPDVPNRQYDDGGLVDVNHLSAEWLAHQLELTPGLAAEIVEQRDRHGGFTTADELVVYCQAMTAQRLDIIRDRLIFVPR